MSDVPALAERTSVAELYQSLMSLREAARQNLRIIEDIERQHRHSPLADLVELAVAGTLRRPGLPRHGGPQR